MCIPFIEYAKVRSRKAASVRKYGPGRTIAWYVGCLWLLGVAPRTWYYHTLLVPWGCLYHTSWNSLTLWMFNLESTVSGLLQ